ncbi:hypothetical protein LCGC14_1861770, partial [marine sediment metagenome]
IDQIGTADDPVWVESCRLKSENEKLTKQITTERGLFAETDHAKTIIQLADYSADKIRQLEAERDKLKAENKTLKADLSYANYHLKENDEMIKLATDVISERKVLRKVLEDIKAHAKFPSSGLAFIIVNKVDEALKGGE